MPDAFAQFKNVVFVANSEKKTCISMSSYCESNDSRTRQVLAMIENEVFGSENEKMFLEAIKNRQIAIRRNKALNKWERCPNTEGSLENEHLTKTLVADATALEHHINRIATATHQVAEMTEATANITADIQQAKKDLAAEKKKGIL